MGAGRNEKGNEQNASSAKGRELREQAPMPECLARGGMLANGGDLLLHE